MSAKQSSPIPMPIDVVSDIVCPWCFIGKRRLEKALTLRPDIAAEVRWRPYFLNDWIPREGIDRKTYLETKFGSVERYAAIAERVAAAARGEGLDYALDKIARQPNTLDCHRLILWARNTSDPGRMKQRLMEHRQGPSLSSPVQKTLATPSVSRHAGIGCVRGHSAQSASNPWVGMQVG